MSDGKGIAWFKGWQAGNRALLVGLRKGEEGVAALPPTVGDYAEWVAACGEAGISLKPTFDSLSGPLKMAFVAWVVAEFKQLLDDWGKK